MKYYEFSLYLRYEEESKERFVIACGSVEQADKLCDFFSATQLDCYFHEIKPETAELFYGQES